MSLDVTLELPLTPIGKGRPRTGRTRTGVTVVYTPEKTVSWEAAFRALVAQRLPAEVLECPIRVDVLAVLPRPQRLLRRRDPDGLLWAPTKPDEDNLRKAVLDGLKRHLRDDAQVVAGSTLKAYAERTGLPRTVVRLRTLEPTDDPATLARDLGLLGGDP